MSTREPVEKKKVFPAGMEEGDLFAPANFLSFNPFISFWYSKREVSLRDGKTHINIEEKSFQNGKFKDEKFVGVMEGDVYHRFVGEMQKALFSHLEFVFKSFLSLLPLPSGKDKTLRQP
ncbi:MAG: hypothetical protein N2317_00035 [Syntrophales bacterium]|nr:hypothetical protein [Syntrophales bacterium]